MARYNFVTNLNGAGYKVFIYTKYTMHTAKIYDTNTSTTSIQTVPQITTNSTGLVSFWVDTDDYSYNQSFNIEIYDIYNKHYSTMNDVSIFDVSYYDSLNPLPVSNGGTGNINGTVAGTQLGITELGGLTTPLPVSNGGTGNINGIYEIINISGTSESAGISAYGTGSSITAGTPYSSIVPNVLTAIIGGTVGTAETITAQPTITYSSSTAGVVLLAQSLSAGATGNLTWDLTSISSSYISGSVITNISLAASSNASSTLATIVGNVVGMEFM